jgi:hypothetical protein
MNRFLRDLVLLIILGASASAIAGENRWLLGTGIVFPALNGAMITNASTYPNLSSTAIEGDYGWEGGAAGSSTSRDVMVSYATGGGPWGGGIALASSDSVASTGSQSNVLYGGLGGRVAGIELGVMSSLPVSPTVGGLDFSFGLFVPGGDGLSWALVVPSGFDSVAAGFGVSKSDYSLEFDLSVPMGSGDLTASLGAGIQTDFLGVAFIASSPIRTSTFGVGSSSITGGLSLRLTRSLSALARIPTSGNYLVGLNWAI